MKRPGPYLILLFLGATSFSLATMLQPKAALWEAKTQSGGVLDRLLGESRQLFASQFFTEADVSFHSGYYPSIFDQAKAPKDSRHMTAKEGSQEEEEHEKQMNFLGPPKDWVERFGRNFFVTDHTHLEGSKEAEILPWLRLSAELDPQRVDTYTVAAYWLRNLGKVTEAEQFLREGLRHIPDSYELLFDLGRLYNESCHDAGRARNVWELALRRWREQQAGKKDPDRLALEQIAVNLARLEEKAGQLDRAISYLELAAKASRYPQTLQGQIAELKQKAASGPAMKPAAGQP